MLRSYFLFSLYFFFFITLFPSKLSFAQQGADETYQHKQDSASLIYKNLNARNELTFDSLNAFRLRQEPVIPVREKKFIRAGTEWFLTQAFPASFNRFI